MKAFLIENVVLFDFHFRTNYLSMYICITQKIGKIPASYKSAVYYSVCDWQRPWGSRTDSGNRLQSYRCHIHYWTLLSLNLKKLRNFFNGLYLTIYSNWKFSEFLVAENLTTKDNLEVEFFASAAGRTVEPLTMERLSLLPSRQSSSPTPRLQQFPKPVKW